MSKVKIQAQFLGLVDYPKGLELMHALREKRMKNLIPDQLLFLEHPPVITMGRRNASEDFLLSPEEIQKRGVSIVPTDRGGKLTYHGPGQMVVYFIFNIAARKLPIDKFVWMAEEGLRLLVQDYGITAERDSQNPGLWVGSKKIASVGFHVHKGITTHGIALNVINDLTPFSYMIPCGIANGGVTSILLETKNKRDIADTGKRLLEVYRKIFK